MYLIETLGSVHVKIYVWTRPKSAAECFLALEFRSRSEGFRDKFSFRSDPKGLSNSLVFIFWCFVLPSGVNANVVRAICLIEKTPHSLPGIQVKAHPTSAAIAGHYRKRRGTHLSYSFLSLPLPHALPEWVPGTLKCRLADSLIHVDFADSCLDGALRAFGPYQ